MRLTELEPHFLPLATPGELSSDGRPFSWKEVDNIVEAQGIRFLCPVCFAANKGPVGTHQVICWSRSRGVPEDEKPGPGRWKLDGSGYDDLTLNADPPSGSRSVLLTGGCGAHFHVTAGEVTV
jgi:hypothetical protein